MIGNALIVFSLVPWTVEYATREEGPRTVYEGVVRIAMDDYETACMSYCFPIGEGPVFEPMLSFDSWGVEDGELKITWCVTPSDLQVLPVQVPRFFKFSVQRTSFGPEDLNAMLAAWGTDSPWDLTGDGTVDGKDLTVLLAGWSPQ